MNGFEEVYLRSEHHYSSPYEPPSSGLVQPYGMLLVLRASDLKVLQVSTNTTDCLKILSPGLQVSLPQLFDQDSIERIRRRLHLLQDAPNLKQSSLLKIAQSPEQGHQCFDGILHPQGETLLLELEPIDPEAPDLFDLHFQLRSAITQIQAVAELQDFLQLAASEIRALTGFDRVMIYQFDAQSAGEVVAEAKREDLFPYLGLHYPASDIPEQPRHLYAQGLLRYIPDLMAPNVALLPIHPASPQPAPDLSFVGLRGTDPCCVEYHRNMGVAAMMVIGLVKDQQLWGLISCHHQTPKRLPYAVRSVCELMGQFIASELANKVNVEELEDIVRLKRLQSEFVASIAEVEDLKAALTHPAPRLLDLVGAEGVAVCLEDEITLIGATPTVEQIEPLIQWADPQIDDSLFYTHSLPKHYPPAMDYKETASGLLLLRISQVRRYYVLWFRPEVLQTINWAGDPHAAQQVTADGQVVLSPRRSFEQWQETVQLTALPWKASELANARDLRNAIVGIVLNKADELAHINRELARSNQELESFAYAASHDLKEPLRGIHNYATFLVEDYTELLDEAGIDRLQTLVKLTQRMESLIDVLLKFSQLGQAELHRQPTDLNELLQQVINVFRISHPKTALQVRVPRPLPTVNGDPVLISEVFSNLLSNADKYNDKADPWVEVGYFQADELVANELVAKLSPTEGQSPHRLVFYVRDNGIGIRERHLETIFRLFKRLHPQGMYGGGTGAGLTIAKKIVERHGGQIWVESLPSEGSTFYLTLE